MEGLLIFSKYRTVNEQRPRPQLLECVHSIEDEPRQKEMWESLGWRE